MHPNSVWSKAGQEQHAKARQIGRAPQDVHQQMFSLSLTPHISSYSPPSFSPNLLLPALLSQSLTCHNAPFNSSTSKHEYYPTPTNPPAHNHPSWHFSWPHLQATATLVNNYPDQAVSKAPQASKKPYPAFKANQGKYSTL